MTTINNSENLIEKVGGIKKAREIVEGAHWENISYSNGSYYSHSCGKNDICLEDLRTAIAEHDEQIKCWSCNKYMTKSQRSANDGFCIHCGNEVDLGCNHNFEDVTIYGDLHKTYQCTICEFRDEEAERHG